MSFSITGDFAKLREWADKFGRAEEFMSGLAQNLAAETVTLIADGFRAESDPYGDKWRPLVPGSRSGQILSDKGGLKGSWHIAKVGPDEFTVRAGVFYAVVHQEGRRIVPRVAKALRFKLGGKWVFSKGVTIPARPMIPTTGRGLPAAWDEAYGEVIDEKFQEAFSG